MILQPKLYSLNCNCVVFKINCVAHYVMLQEQLSIHPLLHYSSRAEIPACAEILAHQKKLKGEVSILFLFFFNKPRPFLVCSCGCIERKQSAVLGYYVYVFVGFFVVFFQSANMIRVFSSGRGLIFCLTLTLCSVSVAQCLTKRP